MKPIILALVLLVPALATAQTPEETFQRALRLERTQGDYAGAIALYESIARDADDRRLGARALIQLARAQENLGRADAAQTYRRVIADYPDITDLAAEARAGFARTNEPVPDTPEPMSTTELLWDKDGKGSTTISPSGRFVLGIVGSAARPSPTDVPFGLQLIETATGDTRLIPIRAPEPAWSSFVHFSPDESMAALVVGSGPRDDVTLEITTVDLESGISTVLLDMAPHLGGGRAWAYIGDWSRDGSRLLIVAGNGRDEDYREVLMEYDFASRVVREIATISSEESFFWEQACFDAEGRYAFVDLENPGSVYIRRFDLRSGESMVWRSKNNMSTVSACTWSTGEILYAVEELAGMTVYAADPAAESSSEDRKIAVLPKDAWVQAGSKGGDLITFTGHVAGWEYVVGAIDPNEGQSVSVGETFGPAFRRGSMWSPSAERVFWTAWAPGGVRGHIWSPASRERRSITTEEQLIGGRWLDDEYLYYMTFSADSVMSPHLLHVGSGEQQTLDGRRLKEMGLNSVKPLTRSSWLAWSSSDKCLVAIQANLEEWSNFRCFTGDEFRYVNHIASPFSEDVFTYGIRKDNSVEGGLLSEGGASYRPLFELGPGNGRVWDSIAWVSEHSLALGEQAGGRLVSMRELDVRTLESREILSEMFEEVEIMNATVSPGLRYVAAYVSWKEQAARLTVVHNVLGAE